MSTEKLIAIAVITAILGVLFRYDIEAAAGAGAAYSLDRWTGDVYFLRGMNQPVKIEISNSRPMPD